MGSFFNQSSLDHLLRAVVVSNAKHLAMVSSAVGFFGDMSVIVTPAKANYESSQRKLDGYSELLEGVEEKMKKSSVVETEIDKHIDKNIEQKLEGTAGIAATKNKIKSEREKMNEKTNKNEVAGSGVVGPGTEAAAGSGSEESALSFADDSSEEGGSNIVMPEQMIQGLAESDSAVEIAHKRYESGLKTMSPSVSGSPATGGGAAAAPGGVQAELVKKGKVVPPPAPPLSRLLLDVDLAQHPPNGILGRGARDALEDI